MRIGKLGVYSLAANAPLPDNSNYDTIFRVVGSDQVFGKKVTGQVYVVGADAPPSINVGNSLFVDSVFGNDGTAMPQRQDLPYKTITAAQNAAQAGNMLVINSGNYADTFLGKDGINYYFNPGAKMAGQSYYFVDGGNQMTYSVLGYGEFQAQSGLILYISNPQTVVNFNCLRASGVGCFEVENGTLTVNCIEDIISTTAPCVRMDVNAPNIPQVNIKARNVISDRVILFVSTHGAGYSQDGYMKVVAEKLLLTSISPFTAVSGEAGIIDIHADIEAEVTAFGLFVGVVNGQGSKVNVYGNCRFNNGYSFSNRDLNSVVTFYGEISSLGLIANYNGVVDFRNKVVNNFPAREAILHNGGKTIVNDLVKNLDASATGHGIVTTSAGIVLKQSASIFLTGAADSVNSSQPETIKSYPGSSSNASVSVNITEVVSNIYVNPNVDSEI